MQTPNIGQAPNIGQVSNIEREIVRSNIYQFSRSIEQMEQDHPHLNGNNLRRYAINFVSIGVIFSLGVILGKFII